MDLLAKCYVINRLDCNNLENCNNSENSFLLRRKGGLSSVCKDLVHDQLCLSTLRLVPLYSIKRNKIKFDHATSINSVLKAIPRLYDTL